MIEFILILEIIGLIFCGFVLGYIFCDYKNSKIEMMRINRISEHIREVTEKIKKENLRYKMQKMGILPKNYN